MGAQATALGIQSQEDSDELVETQEPEAGAAPSPDAASDSTIVYDLRRLRLDPETPTDHRPGPERSYRTRSPSPTGYYQWNQSRLFGDTRTRESADTFSSSPGRSPAASRNPNTYYCRTTRYSYGASATAGSSRRSRSSGDDGEFRRISRSNGTTYFYYRSGSSVRVDGPIESEYYEPPTPEHPHGRHIINLGQRRRRR
ncbi:hypothetical protein VTH06DRAFT_4993 [Thermothelomyces fergusii]